MSKYIYIYRYRIYIIYFLTKNSANRMYFFWRKWIFCVLVVESFNMCRVSHLEKKTHELFLTKNLVLPYNSHPLKPFRNLQSKPSKWNRSNLWVNLKRLELQLGKWGAFENFGVVRDVEPERIDLATQKLNLLVGIFCLWRKGKAA